MDDRAADAEVSRAIDLVLECERAARDAVAQCERERADALERAREQRRRILDRAQQRILALHTRCSALLERRLAVGAEERDKSATAMLARWSDPQRQQRSLERLAVALTTRVPGSQDDAA